MINQNVGTEWIEIKKDIKTTLDKAKYVLTDYRKKLERRSIDEKEWQAALKDFRDKITQVNKKVSSYNLSVPVLRMQIMEYKADRLLEQLQSQWEVDRKTWKKSWLLVSVAKQSAKDAPFTSERPVSRIPEFIVKTTSNE